MTCPKCQTDHDPKLCQGHVIKDPITRDPIPPRQCAKTPRKGATVCRSHGAAKGTPAAAKAEERLLEQRAEKELSKMILWNPDAEPVTDSVSQLQKLTGQIAQSVDVLGARLSGDACPHCGRGAEPLDGPTAALWMRGLREQRAALTTMEQLGIYSRAVEVDGAKVRKLGFAVELMFEALQVAAEQRELGLRVLFDALRAGETGSGQVTA